MDKRNKKMGVIAVVAVIVLLFTAIHMLKSAADYVMVVGGEDDYIIHETAVVDEIGPKRQVTVEILEPSGYYDEEENPYQQEESVLDCNRVNTRLLDGLEVSDVIEFVHFHSSPYDVSSMKIIKKGDGSTIRQFVELWLEDSEENQAIQETFEATAVSDSDTAESAEEKRRIAREAYVKTYGEYMTDNAVDNHMGDLEAISANLYYKNPDCIVTSVKVTKDASYYEFKANIVLDKSFEQWGSISGRVEMKDGKINVVKIMEIEPAEDLI